VTDTQPAHVVFLDLETTGLSPKRDRILEIAVVPARIIALDSCYVEELDAFTALVYTPDVMQYLEGNDVVIEMHTKSGLLDHVQRFGRHSVAEVEAEVLAFLRDCGFEPGKTILAGSSVWFDRGFLREHMPDLESFFHHRMLDVSAIRVLAQLMVDPRVGERLRAMFGEARHRALSDCEGSIQELSLYMQCFLDHAGFWATTLSKVQLEGDDQ